MNALYSAGNASALRQLQGPAWYYRNSGGAAPWRVWCCIAKGGMIGARMVCRRGHARGACANKQAERADRIHQPRAHCP
jgi:hypothetical protein